MSYRKTDEILLNSGKIKAPLSQNNYHSYRIHTTKTAKNAITYLLSGIINAEIIQPINI